MKLQNVLGLSKRTAIVLLILVGGGFIFSVRSILSPFVVGVVGAYFLNHPVTYLQKYRIPRGLSSFLLVFGTISFVVWMIVEAIPFLQGEIAILSKGGKNIIDSLFSWIEPYKHYFPQFQLEQIKQQLGSRVQDIIVASLRSLTHVIGTGFAIANSIAMTIFCAFIMFYITKDFERFSEGFSHLIPLKYLETAKSQGIRINQALSNYAKGQMEVCLLLFCLYTLSLLLVGFPRPFFIGALAGFLAFIPYVGFLFNLLLALTIAYGHSVSCLVIFCIFLVLYILDSYVFTPRLVGKAIGLHPIWILFVLMVGFVWFGLTGVILALPASAILSQFAKQYWIFYKSRINKWIL